MGEPFESAIGIVRQLMLRVECLDNAFTNTDNDNYELGEKKIKIKNPEVFLVHSHTLDKLAKDGTVDVAVSPREIHGALDGYSFRLNIISKKILCPKNLPEDIEEKVKKVAEHYRWDLVYNVEAYWII
jgi:hypothetical protein